MEIDSELLARLRARHPAKDDRALIEDLARVDLGFNALRTAQQRNALGEQDATVTGDRDLLDHKGLEPPAVTAHEACASLGLLDR